MPFTRPRRVARAIDAVPSQWRANRCEVRADLVPGASSHPGLDDAIAATALDDRVVGLRRSSICCHDHPTGIAWIMGERRSDDAARRWSPVDQRQVALLDLTAAL